jgi:hypothetical protein
MTLYEELLDTARYLVRRNSNKPTDADMRRSVSTAYYALFHRLTDAAVSRLVHDSERQAVLARAFEHARMRTVCQRIVEFHRQQQRRPPTQPSIVAPLFSFLGTPIPPELIRIASVFESLQLLRHDADYNREAGITRQNARDALNWVEAAFADWAAIENTPVAHAFLLLLLTGEPRGR